MASEAASFLARWFFGEIRAMTPQWFAVLFLGALKTKVLRLEQSAVGLKQTRSGFVGPTALLTAIAPKVSTAKGLSGAMIAELPPEHCLARRIEAPARTNAQLAAVAALDLSRKTPFRSADVYVALTPARRVSGGMEATQWVVRREDIARLESNLKTVGVALAGVRVQGQETIPALLADLGAKGQAAGRIWQRLNVTIAVSALLAGLVGWGYPAWLETRAMPELTARLKAVEERAVTLRGEIEGLRVASSEQSAFLGQMVQGPRLASTLRELTVALPDDTWISDLTYTREVVVLSGETAESAAGLVIALDKARAFENPRLSGPISRSTTGGEKFEIALDMRGLK